MKRTEKETLKDQLHTIFTRNANAVVFSFSKLKANDSAALRRKLRDSNCTYRVVKNTLARIAAKDTPMEQLVPNFQGSTAIAYCEADPITLAKIFKDFSKDNKAFTYKSILVDGKVYKGEDLDAVASMPSKPQLISQLMFLLNHPITSLARVLQAPLRDLCLVMKEVKKESCAAPDSN